MVETQTRRSEVKVLTRTWYTFDVHNIPRGGSETKPNRLHFRYDVVEWVLSVGPLLGHGPVL